MPAHHFDPRCPMPGRLVHPVPVDPTGRVGPTRAQARGPRWRRVATGYYVPTGVDASLAEQRVVEQAVRLGSSPGAVTGWASLRMHGAGYCDGRGPDGSSLLPVELVVEGHRLRSTTASRLVQEPLLPGEVVHRYGVRVTEPVRAAFDEVRRARDRREAVVLVDMVAAAGLVPVGRLRAFYAERRGWRRAARVPWVLDHASEHSRSPGETRFRLVWVLDAGLPAPLVNQPIFDREGRLVAIVDLLDPVAGLVGEYDGADHLRVHRRSRDADREERLRRLGLEYVDAVAPDLVAPDRLADRIRSAHARAAAVPGQHRAWTLTPPDGWVSEPPLEARLVAEELSRAAVTTA